MKRDNINIILCEDIDESLTNISRITDVIKMNADNTVSFTAVVFINGIEWEVNKFELHYFIECLDEKQVAYLGSTEFLSTEEGKKRSNGKEEIGSKKGNSQTITEVKFIDLNVPQKGSYEIRVYKYEDEDIVDLSKMEIDECIRYATDEKLVASYSFEVD